MKLLLDTHIFLWWLFDDKKLKPALRAVIADTKNTVYVSSASVWEITTKFRNGKLPQAKEVASDVPAWITKAGFTSLSVYALHAQLAGSLDVEHRDPFDRMLAAQAIVENALLLTEDAALLAMDIPLFSSDSQ